MIFNSDPKRDYTKIPHSVSRCKSLDYLSRGILIFMLSHEHKWNYTMEQLQALVNPKAKLIKMTIFRKAIRQLEEAGYARRRYVRDAGKIREVLWDFHANPISPDKRSKPLKEKKPQITQPNVHLSTLDSSTLDKLNVDKPTNIRRLMDKEDYSERRDSIEGRRVYEGGSSLVDRPVGFGLTEADLECLTTMEAPNWKPRPNPRDSSFNPKTGEYEW